MICPSCETENRPGARFCRACGGALALVCPSCNASVAADQRFCDECGHNLAGGAEPTREPERVAERRLVSVLFADLVGFTALSESRDAEEVRELLSRYFDTCRRLVERYGGTVEKFIGDAVMAVWGTPTANEDDAERAVRTGLDLVAAVSSLADELGTTEVQLRVGVLTGEAAVTVGAQGQGMVAGDLVNTASRIQSIAEPGTVVVGDTTRRATEAAIAYDDLGFHELKGKTEPFRVHRAQRVIAARRGEGRSAGLEAPFVGRAREFRLVKDMFHATADEHRARLVSIVGIAGVGKSRLGWEFEKYIDGLADNIYWHRGRCLAYGDGVAYWALAEMVRMRVRVSEDEDGETALPKLREALAGFVTNADERAFLEPRLAHLLGFGDHSAPDKQDLFSAWRLFFERMAEAQPVVLVFEDVQWADAGLLDFIEYLLDWARDHAIYVLTMARPELDDRRTAWGAGRRDFTSLYLEPLHIDEIRALLEALVPGLPRELQERIGDRADGIPLYAVETVRMLLDRGLLKRSGDEYRPVGSIETLAIPETLQSLSAARLDALESEERRLVEDASVLGRTFTRAGLAAVSGRTEEELEPHLQSLLRKELLARQLDPMSPELHQLAFPQDIVRRVAYETLSSRHRKSRHLAAADYLEREADEEIAAVVAAHYLDAYRLGPNDDDAAELRAKARAGLARAGERASSLASGGEACAYFARAAELEDDDVARAELFERAGVEAGREGDFAHAHELLNEATALHEQRGADHAAARVMARRAELLRNEDKVTEALELMQPAYEALVGEGADPGTALVAAQLARIAYFAGQRELALEAVEIALDMGEALKLPEVVAEALTSRATLLYHRPHEAAALMQEAVRVSRENDLPGAMLRAQFNLSGLLIEQDRLVEARAVLEEALAFARRRGDRTWEGATRGQLGEVLVASGEWDRAYALLEDIADDGDVAMGHSIRLAPVVTLLLGYGRIEEAEALLRQEDGAGSSDLQTQAVYRMLESDLLRAHGRPDEALSRALSGVEVWRSMYQPHYAIECYARAFDAALEAGNIEGAEEALHGLESLEPIERRQLGEAHAHRFRGRLAALRGEDPHPHFTAAEELFRGIGYVHALAVTLAEHAECGGGGADEARAIFERLGARPWVDRLDAQLV